MGKIRINDLARELEVKSKFILEHLPKINFLEKKSHSSSLEDEIADKVRAYFRALGEKEEKDEAAAKSAKAAKARPQPSVLTPAKRVEKPVAPPPLRRSLEDIKADLRKKKVAVPPSSLRRIPGVTTRSPGTPARIASPPAAARPAARTAGTVLGKVSPVAAAPRVAAKTDTAPVGGRKQPAKIAKKSRKADASKPLYQLAVRRTPGAVRPGAVRRPGEPHPVHATARGRPAPAGRPAPSPRPTGRRQAGQRRSALPPPKPVEPEVVPITRNITISEGISVKELSEKLDVRVRDVITKLLDRGVFATINQTLENSLATEIS
ncbi:MAG: translation initiation factor IF-2 N-terminal domain-containing protein, partial [Acidobacteria bacterium]|nr:translation initiation factor IF-2 N-terminal domain-containing protein [Acidobacteriota bacterium]